MVRLGSSREAVGSVALQYHSLSLTRQGCSVPMMLAAAAEALTAFATCKHLMPSHSEQGIVRALITRQAEADPGS